MHVGPQGVWLVRSPRLPAVHHASGSRPRPAQGEQDHVAEVTGAEGERGGDTEVAAAAAPACPVQAPVTGAVAGHGGAVSDHDVERPEIVAREAVDARQYADAAA